MTPYLTILIIYTLSTVAVWLQFRLTDKEIEELPSPMREYMPYVPFIPIANTFYALTLVGLDVYLFFKTLIFKIRLYTKHYWEIFIFSQYWKIQGRKIKEQGVDKWLEGFNKIFSKTTQS